MKLVSNKKKKIITVLTILGVLVLLGTIVSVVVSLFNTTPEIPTVIQSINVFSKPKTEYYVGEEFDPTGIVIQVITNKQDEDYLVRENELTFSGFDSSEEKESLAVTVTYQGYSTTFNVRIKKAPTNSTTPVLTAIRLSDNFKNSYSLKWWNTYGPVFDGVKLILTYSDGAEKEVSMQSQYCSQMNFALESAGTTGFVIKYNDGGVIVETTVTITITE